MKLLITVRHERAFALIWLKPATVPVAWANRLSGMPGRRNANRQRAAAGTLLARPRRRCYLTP